MMMCVGLRGPGRPAGPTVTVTVAAAAGRSGVAHWHAAVTVIIFGHHDQTRAVTVMMPRPVSDTERETAVWVRPRLH